MGFGEKLIFKMIPARPQPVVLSNLLQLISNLNGTRNSTHVNVEWNGGGARFARLGAGLASLASAAGLASLASAAGLASLASAADLC